ncbi:uncharacterized protein BXZ73DRAFT_83442 [Epithele typhae]|uniref:uncharacterized protein n=1 Tax=Epithele typhae TaxID=378194 RepID=UPI002007A964|nr:uncharacterized protein BXZ73DRAFT_83442 [Epithele typhae]KAH9910517.1 hypothetical protein BXZ73DRAFT_83442 [Epithele typhae]
MFASVFTPSRSPDAVRYRKIITWHLGNSATSLDFSAGGDLLACGGKDGLQIWNTKSLHNVPVPEHRDEWMGPISQVMWIQTRASGPVICYGTTLGYLRFLKRNDEDTDFSETGFWRIARSESKNPRDAEILTLANHVTRDGIHIVAGTRAGHVLMCRYNETDDLRLVFNRTLAGQFDNIIDGFQSTPAIGRFQLQDHASKIDSGYCRHMNCTIGVLPYSIHFASKAQILVFGLEDGSMYVLRADDGKTKSLRPLAQSIGSAAVSDCDHLLLIDNVVNGFDLWNLGEVVTHKRTFSVDRRVKGFYPRQVRFAEKSRVIVGGSTHREVYIFDRTTGAPLEVLEHAAEGRVQTIANVMERVHIASRFNTIATKLGTVKTVKDFADTAHTNEAIARTEKTPCRRVTMEMEVVLENGSAGAVETTGFVLL